MLGSLIIYLKGMRRMMFQLSGFYFTCVEFGRLGCTCIILGLLLAATLAQA